MRITLTAMLVLALAALPACGGDGGEVSSEELEERISEAQQNVQAELSGLSEAESADELRERAQEAADAVRTEADALADVDPPENAEGARDQFVEALRTLADQLEQQSENIDEADVDRFLDQFGDLSSEDLEGVLDQLRDAGMEIPTTEAP